MNTRRVDPWKGRDILHITSHIANMPAPDKKPRTLYDKVFEDHIVDEKPDGTILLYIGKDCGSWFLA